jgi:hypothetical protein
LLPGVTPQGVAIIEFVALRYIDGKTDLPLCVWINRLLTVKSVIWRAGNGQDPG